MGRKDRWREENRNNAGWHRAPRRVSDTETLAAQSHRSPLVGGGQELQVHARAVAALQGQRILERASIRQVRHAIKSRERAYQRQAEQARLQLRGRHGLQAAFAAPDGEAVALPQQPVERARGRVLMDQVGACTTTPTSRGSRPPRGPRATGLCPSRSPIMSIVCMYDEP